MGHHCRQGGHRLDSSAGGHQSGTRRPQVPKRGAGKQASTPLPITRDLRRSGYRFGALRRWREITRPLATTHDLSFQNAGPWTIRGAPETATCAHKEIARVARLIGMTLEMVSFQGGQAVFQETP